MSMTTIKEETEEDKAILRRAAQLIAHRRWAKTTPEQRKELGRWLVRQRPGHIDQAHCPCGAMTTKRARMRGHKCEAPPAPAKKAKKAKP